MMILRSDRTAIPMLVVAVLTVVTVPGLGAQDEIVARGNQAYQEGDYAAAVEAYQAVVEGGFRSAGLEYNLGNAHFKAGELGRAILHWERALELSPGDPDVQANLELARSLTVDEVEPLPTFWLFSVVSWWVDLLPRHLLLVVVALGWLALTGGVILRVLQRRPWMDALGRVALVVGAVVVLALGPNLLVREAGVGRPARAVILAESVPVRSAPALEDDLTLFQIHEGTRVRVEETAGDWAEVVLDDGKVGWVPAEVFEII